MSLRSSPKTQVSSLSSEYQDQRDDEYEPANPHPTVIPTMHSHVITVQNSSSGSRL
jgi:hypothetical protein